MNIVQREPPNIEEIKKVCTVKDTTVYTYGDTIYVPSGGHVSHDLLLHELTHSKRQAKDVEGWWKKYLEDPQFRLEEELIAYKVQYRSFEGTDREKKALFLRRLAGDLSGEGYGNIISFGEAVKLIRA